jgi:hypothetical protein
MLLHLNKYNLNFRRHDILSDLNIFHNRLLVPSQASYSSPSIEDDVWIICGYVLFSTLWDFPIHALGED